MDLDVKNIAPLSGAAVACVAAGVATAAVYRAVTSGQPRAPPTSAVGPSDQPALQKAIASLQDTKADIASTLSKAVQLRSISFEYPDGRVASLIGLGDGAASAESAARKRSGGNSGCACNCHAVQEAIGQEEGATSGPASSPSSTPAGIIAAAADAVSSPTSDALATSRSAVLAFHRLLEERFPLMHKACKGTHGTDSSAGSHNHSHIHSPEQGGSATVGSITRHVVNELSLVYVWRGSGALDDNNGSSVSSGVNNNTGLGFGLAGHMDVVPVPDAAEWSHPPFAGHVGPDPATGQACVWGRGAIDDKHSVIAICSAVESLLACGYVPSAPYIVLMFGHDEELGGGDGAAVMAQELPRLLRETLLGRDAAAVASTSSNGKQLPFESKPLSFLLDEGLFLLSDFVPAHAGPVAVVCVGEKGHLNVEVSVEAPSGHSSVPGPTTTIGILSKAITAIEGSPFTANMKPADGLLAALLPGLPFLHRLVLGNLWLTGPLVRWGMLHVPASAAMLRTTTAVTLINGGLKSNVLPPRASAVVNHRIHPKDCVDSVVAHDTAAVADPRVKLRPFEQLEPAPVSSSSPSAPGWASISAALTSVFGPAVTPAPGLMLGNTDTRHYWGLARDIYRHCPTELSMAGTRMFHGKDERITVDNLARIAQFYAHVIVEGCARTTT